MTSTTRRAVLGASLAAGLGALTLGLAGCGPDRWQRSGTLSSRHWPGQSVGWRLALPVNASGDARVPVTGLVIALHGKGGDAGDAFDGLHLDEAARGLGLAVASVDGEGWYWHARRAGVDPGAMVVDDLVPLMRRETGWTGKVAFLGWSMGGYGALLLASSLGPQRVAAVVAESAALWTSPGASAPGAFDDRADFEAHDVFRRTQLLRQIPVRLDCGASDPFLASNRAFARELPTARLTVDPGGHDDGFWAGHALAQLRWVRAQYASGQ